MSQSLISLITLITVVAATPIAVRQIEDPASAVTTSSSCSTYYSVEGDTCASIGAKFQLSADDIYNANTFLDCSNIWTNTPICLKYPEPTATITFSAITTWYVPNCAYTYYSVAGDTCDSIGAANGQSGSAIWDANTFLNCNDIWVGTPICVPPASTTVQPSTTVVTDSFITFSPITTWYVPNCDHTYYSVAGDTCDSIGAANGQSGSAIWDANTFLNCNDIWVGTPICVPPASTTTGFITTVTQIPDTCVSTYYSVAGDTCDSIGALYHIPGSAIYQANQFLNCSDIWVNTPICVPYLIDTSPSLTVSATIPIITDIPPVCIETYTSHEGDTCDSIGAQYGISGSAILAANTFLNCTDIWTYTPVCIPFQVDATPIAT